MREVKIETATPGLLQGQSNVPHQRGHLHYDVNNENNEVDNPCADGNTHDGNTDDTNGSAIFTPYTSDAFYTSYFDRGTL